jgi:D-glycero-alpha-D-manno-heptose-7-phosphate kinase
VIHASAPTRFDFAGAPTDVEPFKSEEGGYVVNASLAIRVNVSIVASGDTSEIVVVSRDLGTEERFTSIETMDLDGELRLIKAVISHVQLDGGVRITTSTDAPAGSGLGASAALAVALLRALRQFKGEEPTALELAGDALHVENVLLGNINGGQDQYAAALGGFHAFEFAGSHVDIHPIEVSAERGRSLEERSVLCYSGESRLSGHVLNQVMADYTRRDHQTVISLRNMKRIAHETREALAGGSFAELGELIKATGETQRAFHPAFTPPAVERLLHIGEQHGALGAKMAGAGGGGCVYFFCEPERTREVRDALIADGTRVLPVQFQREGVLTAQGGS